MVTRVSLFVLAVTLLTCGLVSPQAMAAADQVGLAVIVRNNVSEVQPTPAKISVGDDVVRDEIIQTMADSSAKVVLKDSTNLVLGPNSTLKLDRTVFTDQTSIGEIAIKLTTGSFRFITGNSAKEAYAITTPIATLGIRGTVLDFDIQPLTNQIVLKSGKSHVCANNRTNTGNPNNPPNNPANTNNTGTNCVDLTQVGDAAIVTADGNIRLEHSDASFDCQGICDPVTFAEAENLTTGSIPGGGGGGGAGPTGQNPTGPSTNPGNGTSPSTTTTTTGPTTTLIGTSGGGSTTFNLVTPQ
jgi:hypothetical protein